MILANDSSQLIYIHDPMCSWCWAYQATWPLLQADVKQLDSKIEIHYLAGGLASDTQAPMPEPMQQQIQQIWHRIQQQLGTQFNFDFWRLNQPRRATELACKAVIAAGLQAPEFEPQMLALIQRAYYLEAKNPSDAPLLLALGQSMFAANGSYEQFEQDFNSAKLDGLYRQQVALARKINDEGFPALRFWHQNKLHAIRLDYQNPAASLNQIDAILTRSSRPA